ncbi:pentapeptide repeat-containing protein [Rhodobacter ferrooxidans]|uniref:Pentapeptide repeat protein n=1 Tax=Rhodobacter ferrooxidans TaxID=371731 RepID=C8S1E8_9RHOB|nr:pentapeptide repeat-containing protein [Rhodobacter sp. SW2]EEW25121.1 pentapeptide repeat protein [Rhodobacter sp. SW2]
MTPDAVTAMPLPTETVVVVILLVLAVLLALPLIAGFIGDKRKAWRDKLPDRVVDYIGIVIAVFFVAALVAAGLVLVDTISNAVPQPKGATPGPNLGAGALIAALLGAPFVIWATVIKHRTLTAEMDGQITDRISKAVEQLGAEKVVSYIARNVTRQARPLEQREGDDDDWVDQLQKLDRESLTHDRTIEKGTEYAEWKVFSETVPNIEVRIGGILSLERIAQDSVRHDQGRDHVRVMEILCAYIRENAPASGAKDHPYGEWEPLMDDPTEEERAAHLVKRKKRFGDVTLGTGLVRKWAETLPKPRADIAIALHVIGRRGADQRVVEARWGKDALAGAAWVFDDPTPTSPETGGDAVIPQAQIDRYLAEVNTWKVKIATYRGYRLDLRNTNLQGADLSGHVLSGVRLNAARMEGADLGQVRMEAATLEKARMEGAILVYAALDGAFLREVRLEGADLMSARMEGAKLPLARMEGANLMMAKLEGAQLLWARLEKAELGFAHMEGADLRRARLDGAFLGLARLEGGILELARLDGADLRQTRMNARTKLSKAALSGAVFREVDYSTVLISQDQINATFGDGSVVLPAPLTRPAHWPQQALDFGGFDTEYQKWQSDPAAYTPPPEPASQP